MANSPLSGRYKLYKAGTSKVVNWLANAASRCCDIKTVVQSLGSSASVTKHKRPASRNDVVISTKELLKLAEAIVHAKSPQPIPADIIHVAKDVITGREQCAAWYAGQVIAGDSSIAKENSSHRFFIEVLRRIVTLLEEAHVRNTEASVQCITSTVGTACKKDKPANGALENLFSLLEVQEPSASPLGQDSPSLLENQAKPTLKTNFKPEIEDKQPAFATWCFLQDLHDVRCFVKEVWLEYSRGETSFLAASSITDIAFGLLRSADDAFVENKEGCQSTHALDLDQFLGLAGFPSGSALWLCPSSHGTSPTLPTADANVVELLCPIAQHCLIFARFDVYDYCEAERNGRPLPEVCCIGQRHRFHKFGCILFKLLPELHEVAHSSDCEYATVDEFAQGFTLVHTQGRYPMWLIVACQIYLDMYDILGDSVGDGFDAVQQTFDRHQSIGKTLSDFYEGTGDCFTDVCQIMHKLA